MSADLVLTNARVVAADGDLSRGHVGIRDGRIAFVGEAAPGDGADGAAILDLEGAWVVPGFIDLHVHGGDGHDFAGIGATASERVDRICRFHARFGTTGLLATIAGRAPAALVETVAELAALGAAAGSGASVLGLHLEGPFLNPLRRGAIDEKHLCSPDTALLNRLVAAGDSRIRLMTLAPELPGGGELVDCCVDAGVAPAIGHSDASYDEAGDAISRGVRHVTHACNGMRPYHHRDPGVLGAGLDADGVTCDVIADGVHVHPAMIRLIHRAKTSAQMTLITDAVSAAGGTDGAYMVGEIAVSRIGNSVVRADGTSLAGSVLTMGEAVSNATQWLGESLRNVVTMASTTPARIIGMRDRKGQIAPGYDADLVVLDHHLSVQRTMVAGVWVYDASRDGS